MVIACVLSPAYIYLGILLGFRVSLWRHLLGLDVLTEGVVGVNSSGENCVHVSDVFFESDFLGCLWHVNESSRLMIADLSGGFGKLE